MDFGNAFTNLPFTRSLLHATLLLPENFLLIGHLNLLAKILDLYIITLARLSENDITQF